jgi:hypothetical protein
MSEDILVDLWFTNSCKLGRSTEIELVILRLLILRVQQGCHI